MPIAPAHDAGRSRFWTPSESGTRCGLRVRRHLVLLVTEPLETESRRPAL